MRSATVSLLTAGAAVLLQPMTTLRWEPTTPLPAGRDHHVTFVTNGSMGTRLNVAGGTDYREVHDTYWSAVIGPDGGLGDWVETGPLPRPLAGHGVAVGGGGVLLVAGQRPGLENVPDVWFAELDPDGLPGAWAATTPLPGPRFHHTVVQAGEWVYVIGGLETRLAAATVFRGRLSRGGIGEWLPATELPEPRSHHASVSHEGALYVIGGQTGNPAGELVPHNSIVRAEIRQDGALGDWRLVGRMDSTFAAHAAFVLDGYLHVAGGVENNRRVTDRVLRAPFLDDGTLGVFEATTTLPRPRSHVHQMPVVSGAVYTAGGSARRQTSPDVHVGR